ncbi:hypothetical protein CLV58_12533 [Spirosoma oryzae]|uniref:Uncharacterized protein n=1 Tax=Spirosoma oryzae TaxID=1469603 RepID=A0A2T0S8R0_9BACT|nr:hypothetical protein [Spirosoma oryzae]PRY29771.1 hypothetical protein CLV58_12533 [Spirosoma oryzae]
MSAYSEENADLLPIDDDGNFLAHSMLMIDSHHGQYIPQLFAKTYATFIDEDSKDTHFDENMASLLAGPDDEWYWDAWDSFLNQLRLTMPKGKDEVKITLHHDEDLWGVPMTVE